ncbi:TPA: hypothetical protein DCZ15_02195 [Candidatus Falkowbacteria bacterium]|nr:hypothetical protein [Candidatus Falkowbacteria bacterium]
MKKYLSEKFMMLKNNPKTIAYWFYKFCNIIKHNALNNGERYDPNILGKFCINDYHQEARYHWAQKLISQHDTVIDIACGTGYGTLLLADSCRSVVGADISSEAIQYANKHYKTRDNIDFVKSDIADFQGTADVVVSFETIEHINLAVADCVNKLLSLAGKKLLCSVPYRESAGRNKHHVHFDLDERHFDYLKKDFPVNYLYQSRDGTMHERPRGETLNLLIIVDKTSE